MFGDLDSPPNASRGLSATTEFLVLSVIVVICYQIQLIMDHSGRLVRLSFYLVGSGEGLCPSPEKF